MVAALTARGQIVRFVGGCVRDALLGREIRDIDLATADQPDEVIASLSAAGIRAIPTGVAHGTITAVIGDRHFEITTLRRDVETDGRHAQVEFTDDWVADAERRDFTINALYCDPDGAVYDPMGGRPDIAAGLVRFVGDPVERIHEDYLRILRFFRFVAWFGRSEPDPAGLAACVKLAPEMAVLAGERIAAELLRLLAAPAPGDVMEMMVRHQILDAVTPALLNVDCLRSLCAFEDIADVGDPIRRMSALLVGRGDSLGAICQRLHLSGRQHRRMTQNDRESELVGPAIDRRTARRVLYSMGHEAFVDLLLLASARQGDVTHDGERVRELVAYAATWVVPGFPVTGADLLAMGIAEGPQIGRHLDTLEQWWVSNDFGPDRSALLARAKDTL